MDADDSWREALMHLHVNGWETDDIDAACEALADVCEDADQIGALRVAEVRELLESEIAAGDVGALRTVAVCYAKFDGDADALRRALFDLDAFAYAYAEED